MGRVNIFWRRRRRQHDRLCYDVLGMGWGAGEVGSVQLCSFVKDSRIPIAWDVDGCRE